jgi:hypothetical protein
MKAYALFAIVLSAFTSSAQAEEISSVCNLQATEFAFTKYADDDFDYIEAISEAKAIDSVEQNNTDLSEAEIKAFRELVNLGENEFYEVSAGGIGDFIAILTFSKSDCSYVSTISVFEE